MGVGVGGETQTDWVNGGRETGGWEVIGFGVGRGWCGVVGEHTMMSE